MKVLDQVNLKTWRGTFHCGCGTKVEVSVEDLFNFRTNMEHPAFATGYTCPTCRDRVWVTVPGAVARAAGSEKKSARR